MIGKTKDDKAIKKEILKNHTLEGVISLNKDTFYRVGTVPCILDENHILFMLILYLKVPLQKLLDII